MTQETIRMGWKASLCQAVWGLPPRTPASSAGSGCRPGVPGVTPPSLEAKEVLVCDKQVYFWEGGALGEAGRRGHPALVPLLPVPKGFLRPGVPPGDASGATASPPWGAGGAVRTEGPLKEKPKELFRCGAQGGQAQGRSSRGRGSAGRSRGSRGFPEGLLQSVCGAGAGGCPDAVGFRRQESWEWAGLGGQPGAGQPPRSRCCLAESSHPSLLCRRRASCCRPNAGPCVPAGWLGAEDPHQHMPSPIKAWSPHRCPVSLLWPPGPTVIPRSPCLSLGFPARQLSHPGTRLGLCTRGHRGHRPPGASPVPFALPFYRGGCTWPGAAVPGGQSWTLLVPCPGGRPQSLAQSVLPWGSGAHSRSDALPRPFLAPVASQALTMTSLPSSILFCWTRPACGCCSRRQDLREQTRVLPWLHGELSSMSEGEDVHGLVSDRPERGLGEGELEPRLASVAFGPGRGGRDWGRLSWGPQRSRGWQKQAPPSGRCQRVPTPHGLASVTWPFLAAREPRFPNTRTAEPFSGAAGRHFECEHFLV